VDELTFNNFLNFASHSFYLITSGLKNSNCLQL
jgi:hypothetical protein